MPFDGLINTSIGSLVNGISQQPPELRLDSQNETQIDCLSDAVKGVSRRPPFEHIKKLIASPAASGYFYHLIDRDATERYVLLIEDDDLRIFDLAGTEKTITKPGDMTYFNSSAPLTDFEAITVADFTFIVNKTIAVAMSGSTTALSPNEFLWICQVNNALNDQIFEFGTSPSPTTVTAVSGGSASSKVVTDNVIAALQASAVDVGMGGNWTFTRIDTNVIHGEQTANTGSPETVKASDNRNDSAHKFIYKRVQLFSELPEKGKDGFIVEVEGDDSNEFDSFYVQFLQEGEVWQEIAKPGLDNNFDATTMPYTLVRTPGGPQDFSLTPGTWAARAAGDEDTAPEPSFVGREIRGLVLHNNRLTVLADENVIASEAGEFFNFWPTTATTLPDSDPIDVAATSDRVTILDYAIPFQRALTVISADANYQGELAGRNVGELTAATARIEERGAFGPISSSVKPVSAENSIFLPVDRETATGILEYVIEDDVAVVDENTAHVPTLIPGNVFHMATQPSDGILVALSSDQPNRLYVYRWFNQGDARLMSSWSFWQTATGDTVRWVGFILSTMYAVIERGDGLHLEKMELRKLSDSGLSYRIHLDDLVFVTGSFSAGTGLTTWTLPYDQKQTGDTYLVVKSGAGFPDAARGALVANPDFTTTASQITAVGDFSDDDCAIGRLYVSELEPSEFWLKERSSQTGTKPIRSGRLQIRQASVLFNDTGAFDVEVTLDGDTVVYRYVYSGITIGVSSVGPVEPSDGDFFFDVGGENRHVSIKFKSSTFLPFSLSGLEWEGFLFRRGERA